MTLIDFFLNFPFVSLLSVRSGDWYGLFSFWWKSLGNMLCRWNGELFDVLFLVFHLSLLFFFLFCWFCWCILAHKSALHPLMLCCSRWGFEFDTNLLSFDYVNLLKNSSSQHIILNRRCPCLLESAELVCIFSLSSSVYLRDLCKHTHTLVLPHTDLQHTHGVVSAQDFQCIFTRLIFCQQDISPAGLCWASQLEWNWVNAAFFYWLEMN